MSRLRIGAYITCRFNVGFRVSCFLPCVWNGCLRLKSFVCFIRLGMVVMVVAATATTNRYNTDRAGTDNTTINGLIYRWPCNDLDGRTFSYHMCHSW